MTIEKLTDLVLTSLAIAALAVMAYFIFDALPGAVDHMLSQY